MDPEQSYIQENINNLNKILEKTNVFLLIKILPETNSNEQDYN